MNSWHDFLDSLATKGGNIFILLLGVFLMTIASVFVFKFVPIPEVHTFMLGQLSGFLGALLFACKGDGIRNPNPVSTKSAEVKDAGQS